MNVLIFFCHQFWLFKIMTFFVTFSAPKEIAYPSVKLDVDSQEDLDKMRALCVGLDKESTAQNIIDTYKKEFGL